MEAAAAADQAGELLSRCTSAAGLRRHESRHVTTLEVDKQTAVNNTALGVVEGEVF